MNGLDLNLKINPAIKNCFRGNYKFTFIEYASKKKVPIIISTGGSTVKEIEEAIKAAYH